MANQPSNAPLPFEYSALAQESMEIFECNCGNFLGMVRGMGLVDEYRKEVYRVIRRTLEISKQTSTSEASRIARDKGGK